jgi:hypothetical protein
MSKSRSLTLLVWVVLSIPAVSAFAQNPPLPPGLTAVAPPKVMPGFTLAGINRPILQSDELRGKIVVLRFWATH